MSNSKANVESIEFSLGNVNYAIGVRAEQRDGIRATWKCQHCTIMGVTSKPKPSKSEALELVKEELLQHHDAFHRILDLRHTIPVSSSRQNG